MTDWDDMSADELEAALDAVLGRLRAIAEAQEVVGLEEKFIESADESWPPMPLTQHPWMERHARIVRELMGRGEWTIMLTVQKPLKLRLLSDEDVTRMDDNRLMLNVERVVAKAPYVGDPFWYGWRVAVDKYKRWVAGEATVVRP